jgi:hypothetical protein
MTSKFKQILFWFVSVFGEDETEGFLGAFFLFAHVCQSGHA